MTTHTCPTCHQQVPDLDAESFDLNVKYYEIGHGVVWNAYEHRAIFDNPISAREFRKLAPDWYVGFIITPNKDK